MSIHRRAAQRDRNEQPIVQALRKAGFIVLPASGAGLPDLLVIDPSPTVPLHVVRDPLGAIDACTGNSVTLLEVKADGGKLTTAQEALFRAAKAMLT